MISALQDAVTIGRRNVLGLTRQPTTIVFSTIQPVIFVLMFVYVFGGAMAASLPPGVSYVNFLIPGIFVQTVTFGATNTAIGLAEDSKRGLIERFRSLPMAPSAVLAGRTLADALRNLFVIFLMLIVGYLVGFRITTDLASTLLAILILLAFGYAMSWLMALLGLSAGNAEAAQAASFPLLAVLVFASTAFVPLDTMPTWLQGFAEYQPVSVTVEAVRHLLIGWPALVWAVVIFAVFMPLSVRRFNKAA